MSLAIGRLTAGQEAGATAFAVTARSGLTAFHCVGDRESGSLTRPVVDIAFRSGHVTAKVDAWDADLDIALLAFDDPLPPGEQAVPLSDEFGRSTYYVRGYPAEAGGVEAAISGQIVDPDARLFQGLQPAIQLQSDQAGAAHPLALGGFSGAPVMVDDPPRAIGVIRWNPPAETDDRFAQGAIVYATPVSALLTVWTESRLGLTLLRPSLSSRKTQADSLLRLRTDPTVQLPTISSLSASDLGALSTRYTKRGTDPYVPRDLDEEIDRTLLEDGCLLLLGPATSGKTRTAAEAVTRSLPQAGLLWPKARPQGLRRLLELDAQQPLHPGPIVVWLDDLQQYLSEDGGLDQDSFALLQQRPGGSFLVATMTLAAYAECLHARDDRGRIADELLNEGTVTQIELPREPSPKERAAAVAAYPAEDWTQPATGIAERLVAARELLNRLRTGRETDPAGWLAVRALIDWVRAGGSDLITEPAWRALFEQWRCEPAGAAAGAATFESALAWARTPVASSVSMVLVSDEDLLLGRRYGVLDYVGENYEPLAAVADVTYRVAVAELSRLDHLTNLLMTAALAERQLDVEQELVTKIKAAGDELLHLIRPGDRPTDDQAAQYWIEFLTGTTGTEALWRFGHTTVEAGRLDDALPWFRKAAEAGDVVAMTDLGVALARQGDLEASRAWTRRAAEAGSTTAMLNLAGRLFVDGDTEQARQWAERAAHTGDATAALGAAWLAAKDQRPDDAIVWARMAAEGGNADGMFALGSMLAERGAMGEAVAWWLRAGSEHQHVPSLDALLTAIGGPAGHPETAAALGQLFRDAGRVDQAEQVWRGAADAGDPTAAYELGLLLRARDDHDGALARLRAAAAQGHVEADTALGVMLFDDGQEDEAINLWRSASSRGSAAAAHNIGHTLVAQDRVEEGRPWLQLGVDRGWTGSMFELGMLRLRAGDADGALTLLRQAGELGHPQAMDVHGSLLLQQGSRPEAIRVLAKAADAGVAISAYRLYEVYALDEDYLHAGDALQRAADLGFEPAATLLDLVDDYKGVVRVRE
jgi:TPR repeat protein